MKTLSDIYFPITASPFDNNDDYCEIAASEALRPYIRCFWGTKYPRSSDPVSNTQGIVIPDTCMDIIFTVNYSRNKCDGFLCTIDEHSYRTQNSASLDLCTTFAIRFYAWTAILFSEQDFTGRKNRAFSVDEFYRELNAELAPKLFDIPDIYGKIAAAEKILLNRLNKKLINSDLMNAIYLMISTSGRAKISDICNYTTVSEKKLQRIFNYNMGVSPKTFSSLLRYQLLWQEMVFSNRFNVLDAVEKFGYTDQAHLLNDFKRRHLMSPKEAIKYVVRDK